MCKWVFKQVTQVRHLHFPISSGGRCLQKVQRLHGVQTPRRHKEERTDQPMLGCFLFLKMHPSSGLYLTSGQIYLGGSQDQTASRVSRRVTLPQTREK